MADVVAKPAGSLVDRAPPRPAQPGALVLLVALSVASFAGVAASAIAFTDVAGRVRWTAFAATSLFLASVIAYALSRTARASGIAAALATVACAGALYVAVEAQRQHDRLREQYTAGRPGPAITLLSGAETSRLARHILTSVAGWTAAITAAPLAAFFAFRSRSTSPTPSDAQDADLEDDDNATDAPPR